MAQKKKTSATENERDELGEEEEETVLLGWNRLRREATPSVAVFPYLFYSLHLLWVNTTLCDVYKGLKNTDWMKGRWRENSAMNTFTEVIMLQLNKLAGICPNWAFKKSLTAKVSTPAWHSEREREKERTCAFNVCGTCMQYHIHWKFYFCKTCLWIPVQAWLSGLIRCSALG